VPAAAVSAKRKIRVDEESHKAPPVAAVKVASPVAAVKASPVAASPVAAFPVAAVKVASASIPKLQTVATATTPHIRKGTTPRKHTRPPTSEGPANKANAVVIWLTTARPRDLKDLGESISSFCKNFSDKYSYPAIIFHEGDLTAEIQSAILQTAAESCSKPRFSFEEVELGPPENIDLTKMTSQFAHWKGRYSKKQQFGCKFFNL
jgi:hypothetical protein